MSIILGVSGIILPFLILVYAFNDLARFQIWVDDRLREIRFETEKLRCDVIEFRKQIRADSEAEEKQI